MQDSFYQFSCKTVCNENDGNVFITQGNSDQVPIQRNASAVMNEENLYRNLKFFSTNIQLQTGTIPSDNSLENLNLFNSSENLLTFFNSSDNLIKYIITSERSTRSSY